MNRITSSKKNYFLQSTTRYLFTPVLCVMLMSYLGCSTCKNTDPIVLLAGRNLKAIGTFQPGTYWVYQNDSTFALDSVAVTSSVHDSVPVTGPCGKKNQDMTIINYKENIYTYTTSFTFNQNYLLKVEIDEPVLLSKENSLADTIFVDKPCIDSSFCNIVDTLKIALFRQPLIFDRYKYLNVYERIDSSSSVEDGNLVHYFCAAHFGIVKKQIYHPDHTIESWTLRRFNIIQ